MPSHTKPSQGPPPGEGSGEFNGGGGTGLVTGSGPMAGALSQVLVEASPIRNFLVSIGLNQPWPTKLSNRADLSLEIVKRVWGEVQADGGAVDKRACLVTRLKAKSFAGAKP